MESRRCRVKFYGASRIGHVGCLEHVTFDVSSECEEGARVMSTVSRGRCAFSVRDYIFGQWTVFRGVCVTFSQMLIRRHQQGGASSHLPNLTQILLFAASPMRLHHVPRPRDCLSGIFVVSPQLCFLVIWLPSPRTRVTQLRPGLTAKYPSAKELPRRWNYRGEHNSISRETLSWCEDKQSHMSHCRARSGGRMLLCWVQSATNLDVELGGAIRK